MYSRFEPWGHLPACFAEKTISATSLHALPAETVLSIYSPVSGCGKTMDYSIILYVSIVRRICTVPHLASGRYSRVIHRRSSVVRLRRRCGGAGVLSA